MSHPSCSKSRSRPPPHPACQYGSSRVERNTPLSSRRASISRAPGQCWWWFNEDEAIREARRLLTPGGRLIICSFSYLPPAGSAANRTEELVPKHNPGWPKAGWNGIHPEHVSALDRGGFASVESFSYTIDVPFIHETWRGRMRTCNGVGCALTSEQVDRFDGDLAEIVSREFPGDLIVPQRVFAASGMRI